MFSSLSIRKKLIIIQTTTAFIAMIICCGLFIYNDIKLFKRSIIRKTSSLVGVIGDNAVSPLLFMDQEAAEEILYNLKDETDIIQANILDKNYRVFGNYLKKDAEKQPAFSFSNLDTLHAEFIGRKLYVRYVIYSGKEILGYVCLISQPNDLQKVINNYMGIAGTVILITLLITFVISYFFSKIFQAVC